MRAIDSPCGHHFEAESDEQLRGRIDADAYDAVASVTS
jgi:hypothetical protein